VVRKKVRELLA